MGTVRSEQSPGQKGAGVSGAATSGATPPRRSIRNRRVLGLHLFGDRGTDLLQFLHVPGGVERLDVPRLDVAECMLPKPLAGQFGVVPHLGEQLGVRRSPGVTKIADLAVEWIPWRHLPKTRQSMSCSLRAANIRADGTELAL